MYCRHEIMFICGRLGTENSSQRGVAVGPSWRLMRMVIVPDFVAAGDVVVAVLILEEMVRRGGWGDNFREAYQGI